MQALCIGGVSHRCGSGGLVRHPATFQHGEKCASTTCSNFVRVDLSKMNIFVMGCTGRRANALAECETRHKTRANSKANWWTAWPHSTPFVHNVTCNHPGCTANTQQGAGSPATRRTPRPRRSREDMVITALAALSTSRTTHTRDATVGAALIAS